MINVGGAYVGGIILCFSGEAIKMFLCIILAEGPSISVHGDLNFRNVVNCIGVFEIEKCCFHQ